MRVREPVRKALERARGMFYESPEVARQRAAEESAVYDLIFGTAGLEAALQNALSCLYDRKGRLVPAPSSTRDVVSCIRLGKRSAGGGGREGSN